MTDQAPSSQTADPKSISEAVGDPTEILKKMFPGPATTDASTVKTLSGMGDLSKVDPKILGRLGLLTSQLTDLLQEASIVNYERTNIYKECDRAISHWLVGASLKLYSEYVTNYSSMHGATVWVKSENKKYVTELNKMLNRIAIEEKIFDLAYTTGLYGDHIIKVSAAPGLGVVMINDDYHPSFTNRLDYNGTLIGFYEAGIPGSSENSRRLLPPWEYVHFRILGSKRRRPVYTDGTSQEFQTINLLSPETRRITSKYGTSLLLDSLPAYKRLRMCEDSLILSRLTRGLLRYIYKVSVDGTNMEAVNAILDQYTVLLKRARAIDTRSGSPNFEDKLQILSQLEDIVLPVWGDTNNIMIDKIGGDPDIRWITDINELRNQLAASLATPMSLLGAYVKEAAGALGSEALEQLDIRFARNARRLQRTIIDGITRLCQIHLAYMNMDPDPRLFTVCMAETSTAEEESLRKSLDAGTETIEKIMGTVDSIGVNMDKLELMNDLSQRFFHLNDLDFKKYVLPSNPLTGKEIVNALEDAKQSGHAQILIEHISKLEEAISKFNDLNLRVKLSRELSNLDSNLLIEAKAQAVKDMRDHHKRYYAYTNMDLKAFTPINETLWKSKYGTILIKVRAA